MRTRTAIVFVALVVVSGVVLGVGAATDPAAARRTARVVGLGDSVMSGAHCGCTPFITQLARGLATPSHPARATNLGVSALTAAALAQQVRRYPVRRVLRGADVVVVTVGANDLQAALDSWDGGPLSEGQGATCDGACDDATLQAIADNVSSVLTTVRRLRAGRPTTMVVTTYWNVFEDGDVGRSHRGAAYARWSDALTRRLNARLCAAAHGAGARCVDLYAPFKGAGGNDPTGLLADDGDHPNTAGHALIARTLLAALRPRTRAAA